MIARCLTNINKSFNSWNYLKNNIKIKYPFLLFDWQKTDNEVFDVKNNLIYEFLENNIPIGICPLRNDNNIVRWSCNEEISDYLDIISNETVNKDLWNYIITDLKTKGIQKIKLRNIPKYSQTIDSIEKISLQNNFKFTKEKEDVVPYISLPKTFNEYLLSLSRKNRHELRRKIRRFEKEIKNWKIVKADKNNIEKYSKIFFENFKNDSKEKETFLNPKMEEYFYKEASIMANLNYLDFSNLIIENTVVSQAISFIFDNTYFLYNQTSDKKYSQISPGLILNKLLIEECITNKIVIYDFMQGGERYKYQLGAKDKYVYKLSLEF